MIDRSAIVGKIIQKYQSDGSLGFGFSHAKSHQTVDTTLQHCCSEAKKSTDFPGPRQPDEAPHVSSLL
jgi:hypothetical protein